MSLLRTAGWTFTCPRRTQHPVPTPTFRQAWLKRWSRSSWAQEAFPHRHTEADTKSQNGRSGVEDPVYGFGG